MESIGIQPENWLRGAAESIAGEDPGIGALRKGGLPLQLAIVPRGRRVGPGSVDGRLRGMRFRFPALVLRYRNENSISKFLEGRTAAAGTTIDSGFSTKQVDLALARHRRGRVGAAKNSALSVAAPPTASTG